MTFCSGQPIRADASARTRRSPASPRRVVRLFWLAALLLLARAAGADTATEYRLKAAFVYNFSSYTHWPGAGDGTLLLCVYGRSPIIRALDPIAGKLVGGRPIEIQQRAEGAPVDGCHVVFITESVAPRRLALLEETRGRPMLTIADSPGAGRSGAAFNMLVVQDRVRFEVNLEAARAAGLRIDPRILRLASEVYQ